MPSFGGLNATPSQLDLSRNILGEDCIDTLAAALALERACDRACKWGCAPCAPCAHARMRAIDRRRDAPHSEQCPFPGTCKT